MIAFAVIGILSLLARPALAICPDPLDVAKGSAHMPRAAPNRASDEAPVRPFCRARLKYCADHHTNHISSDSDRSRCCLARCSGVLRLTTLRSATSSAPVTVDVTPSSSSIDATRSGAASATTYARTSTSLGTKANSVLEA
ncbi:hypothetical protein A4X09_0g6952 [Tilletia walkeri]|uniref:Secreted protein n=1 Tax=Tilletia walkeri TaxID=117179 RepID=A0A8X7N1P5_9BASI|nr:hypothetical protein A4X09_0g6952 [Tilletia walkeri]